MQEFGPRWMRLVNTFNACFDIYDGVAFTVQTRSRAYEFGPYVQAQWLDDEIEIEITSNKFLNPPLDGFYEQRMEFLGWNAPDDNDHPNYWIAIPNTPESKRWAAEQWVRTLRLVYKLSTLCQVEISPVNLKVHEKGSLYLFKIGRPMCFELTRIARPKRNPNASQKKARPLKPRPGKAPAQSDETPEPERTYLEPNAENFPDLFGPM